MLQARLLVTTGMQNLVHTSQRTSGTLTLTAGEYINVSGTDSSTGTPYGTLYNYYAASAGTISGSSNSNNASYDICPAGWRLPIVTNGTDSEFWIINSKYDSSLIRKAITSDGAGFARAGYTYNSTPTRQGIDGYYWSSTNNSGSICSFHIGSANSVEVSERVARSWGLSIRCIAK